MTPLVGCDVFAINAHREVLLVRRQDNGMWALPGGCQELNETPQQCAIRECHEETGLNVSIVRLLGVFSSLNYPYIHYPWKENRFTHLLFSAAITGGLPQPSEETTEIGYFPPKKLPPLSDGHDIRIQTGFDSLSIPSFIPIFE